MLKRVMSASDPEGKMMTGFLSDPYPCLFLPLLKIKFITSSELIS